MAGSKQNPVRYSVPGLEHGLALLRAFTAATPELGAPELTAKLGLPRSTVFRLLQTLESLGYVARAGSGHRYRLGVEVLSIGFEYLASQSVVECGRPLIEDLQRETGLTTELAIRNGRSITYVAKAVPPATLRGTVAVGTKLPLHATTLGRAVLHDCSLGELDAIFGDEELKAYTAHTPVTVQALWDAIQKDRKVGLVIGRELYEFGISAVGVPVRNDQGNIVAALGVTVSEPLFDQQLLNVPVLRRIVETSQSISRGLGYRGDEYAVAMKWVDEGLRGAGRAGIGARSHARRRRVNGATTR